jgi:chemotaxis protein histidine kinase CheA
MQDPHDPVAAIREMRVQFVRGSEKRLASIESKIARLADAPADRDSLHALRLEFHAFSGLGGTYGFRKVSKLGNEGEALCDRVAKARGPGASAGDREAWTGIVASIRKELGLEKDPARARVLAVTADSARAEALQAVLETAGYEVRAVAGSELEAAVREFSPQVLILDSESDAPRGGVTPWLLLAGDVEPGQILAAVAGRLDRARGGG